MQTLMVDGFSIAVLLSVTSFSMPDGPYGNYLVDPDSIEEYSESIVKHNGTAP